MMLTDADNGNVLMISLFESQKDRAKLQRRGAAGVEAPPLRLISPK